MAAKYSNQTKLAARLGISQQAVSGHVRAGLAEGWWVWSERGPWSAADAKAIEAVLNDRRAGNNYGAQRLEEAETDSAIQALSKNPERVARIKLIIERTAKLKLERELLAGGYIKREDAEKERVGRVFSVRAKLQEIPLRASLVSMKTEMECERILTDWMREVCDYYASGGN